MHFHFRQVNGDVVVPVVKILDGDEQTDRYQKPQHDIIGRRLALLIAAFTTDFHFFPFPGNRPVNDLDYERQGSCPDKSRKRGLKSFLCHGKYFRPGREILFFSMSRDPDQNDFRGSHYDLP